MKDGSNAIAVRSTTALSSLPGRMLSLRSGRDVVPRCSIRLGTQSYENPAFVLMAILQGLTENTTSGDVIALAVFRAKDLCRQFGISEDEFNDIIDQYLNFADHVRKKNPLAF